MNNKGFAITTILYGTLILFLMLLLSMLGILSSYKDRLGMLIDNDNAAREIIRSAKFLYVEAEEENDEDFCSCEIYDGTHLTIEYYNPGDDSCKSDDSNCIRDGDGICIVESCSYRNFMTKFTDGTSQPVSPAPINYQGNIIVCIEE